MHFDIEIVFRASGKTIKNIIKMASVKLHFLAFSSNSQNYDDIF